MEDTRKARSGEDYVDVKENFDPEISFVTEEVEDSELIESFYDSKKSGLGQSNGLVLGQNSLDNCIESSSETITGEISEITEEKGEEERNNEEVDGTNGDRDQNRDLSRSDRRKHNRPNLLFWLAGLVIEALGFQLGIMAKSISLLLQGYKLVGSVSISSLMEKLFSFRSSLFVARSISIGRIARKMGWGCFWSGFVCLILVQLFLWSFGMGFFVMHNFVEEPIQMIEPLYFDYTKPHPVACVPPEYCAMVMNKSFEGNSVKERGRKNAVSLPRLIPPHHRLEVGLVLTLPESDYNRNIGIFQVKLEILSAEGNIISTASHPCMIRFKSLLLRIAQTFLFSPSFLVGFSSESQTLDLHMLEYTETTIPTACLRVTLERRAGFRPGEGIPEIYIAELYIHSELPWLKKMIWKWKWSLLIWVGMGFFAIEILVLLLCCRPIIFPRLHARDIPREEKKK